MSTVLGPVLLNMCDTIFITHGFVEFCRFWTMRDDEKSICSISSTEVKEIEKPEEKAVSQRKYRVSDDEKEPGELSSDN